MYAIINAGGKQLRVAKGENVQMDHFEAKPGDAFETDEVLFVQDGDSVQVGRPMVEGAKVTGTVVEQAKDKKIVVFKRKRRKGYRRKAGHRTQYTVVQIDSITA